MHDPAYKLLYSHRRMAADLLRGFLPDGSEAGFDFDTLEPFVNAEVIFPSCAEVNFPTFSNLVVSF